MHSYPYAAVFVHTEVRHPFLHKLLHPLVEAVVVMSETGGEGVSRPGGNSVSAGSAHTV